MRSICACARQVRPGRSPSAPRPSHAISAGSMGLGADGADPRVIAGPAELAAEIEATIRSVLTRPRSGGARHRGRRNARPHGRGAPPTVDLGR